ncbi:MAG: hypothetical protein ABI538_12380 [Pseudoxanthomonas sp.]
MVDRRRTGIVKGVASNGPAMPLDEKANLPEKPEHGLDEMSKKVAEQMKLIEQEKLMEQEKLAGKKKVDVAVPRPEPGPVYTDQLRVTLLRYIVRKEDDGLGGHGVDLYIGYLASAGKKESTTAFSTNFGADNINENGPHGTSQVAPSLTNGNGTDGSGRHEVNELLFDMEVGASPGVMRLNMIESDNTTPAIKKAYDDAKVPDFQKPSGPGGVAAQDIGLFFAVPFAPIIKILQNANTDDDYGQWGLSIARVGDSIECKVVDKGSKSLSKSATIKLGPEETAELTLQYLDNDNDIDAVLELRRVPL